jgi:hypothetical protein
MFSARLRKLPKNGCANELIRRLGLIDLAKKEHTKEKNWHKEQNKEKSDVQDCLGG